MLKLTHVEDPVHLVAVDLALTLDELEDRRHLPGGSVDLGVADLRQNTRNVVREASAGDVRHAVDLDLALHELGDGLEETLVHREKRIAESLICTRQLVLPAALAEIEHDAAGERKAVGLETALKPIGSIQLVSHLTGLHTGVSFFR